MKKLNWIFFLFAGLTVLFSACTANDNPNGNNTTQGDWILAAQYEGSARMFPATFVIGNYAFVGTGWDGNINNNDTINGATRGVQINFFRFDGNVGSWSQTLSNGQAIASMPSGTGRIGSASFAIGGQGFVGLGTDNIGTFFSDFWMYDTLTNSWSQIAPFPGVPRYGAVSFSVDGIGYVGFGQTLNNIYLKDMYAYNPATNTWSNDLGTGAMQKRVGATAFIYNHQAYVVGGSSGTGGLLSDFGKYTPATNSWTQLRQIANVTDSSYDDTYSSIQRQYGAANVILGVNGAPDYAYFSTGSTNTGVNLANLQLAFSPNNHTWQYDFTNDIWSERTPYQATGFMGGTSFVINNNAFWGLGANGSSALDALQQFNPLLSYNQNDWKVGLGGIIQ